MATAPSSPGRSSRTAIARWPSGSRAGRRTICRSTISDVDAACRELVARLGQDGWLQPTAADAGESRIARRAHAVPQRARRWPGMTASPISPSPCRGSAAGADHPVRHAEQQPMAGARPAAGTRDRGVRPVRAAAPAPMSPTSTLTADARRRRLPCSTARRPGSPMAASPISTSSLRAPARRRAPRDFPHSSCRPTRRASTVAERLEVIAPHPLARLSFDNVALPAGSADRQARRRVPHRHVGARRVPLDRRRRGARLCPPRARRERWRARPSAKLFGAPMAELQMVQGHIADMALDVDAAALLVYRAAWTKDMGAARVTREAAMAKLFATDRAQEVIDKAVQLHGGDGVRQRPSSKASIARSARCASTKAPPTCRRSSLRAPDRWREA